MGRDQFQQSIATIISAALAYDGGVDRAAVLKWRRRDLENFIAILTPKLEAESVEERAHQMYREKSAVASMVDRAP
ncbi:hypothetical protein OROMI_010206 [Orobanche minor]